MILIVLWAAIFGWLFYYIFNTAKKQEIDDLNARQKIHADQAARSLEIFFSSWENLLTSFTKSNHIAAMDDPGKSQMDFIFDSHRDVIKSITRVDEHGSIIYAAPFDQKIIGRNIADQKHIKKIMAGRKPVVSDVFRSVQGYSSIALHVPVVRNGDYLGTLGVLFDFEDIAKRYLEPIRIGETGYAWVISAEGVELYCPVPGHVGNSVFETCKDFPTIIEMAKMMTSGREGVTTYVFNQVRDQKTAAVLKHAYYRPIKVLDAFWSIVVAASEDEVLANIETFKWRLIILCGLLVVVAIFLSSYVAAAWRIVKEEDLRKSAESALRESEERFRRLMDNVQDVVFTLDMNLNYTYISPSVFNLRGFSPVEAMNQKVVDVLAPGSYEAGLGMFSEELETENKLGLDPDRTRTAELELIRKDGTTVWTEVQCSFLRDDRGKPAGILGVTRDISERRRTEKALRDSETKFRSVFERARIGLMIIDGGGRVLDLNRHFADIFEWRREDYLGMDLLESLPEGPVRETLVNAIAKGGIEKYEGPYTSILSGKEKTIHITTEKISPEMLVTIIEDVTIRRITMDIIKNSLKEKEILLKEIHHRVKNNFQVIISLLNLQSRSLENRDAILAIQESQSRIRAMSLVHELLYRTDNLSEIDLGAYLSSLAAKMLENYSIRPERVNIRLETDPVSVSIDQASPISLIFNELITNSLKYAFPDQRKGTIDIITRLVDGQLVIHYSDDGVGFPENFDWRNTNSLGLRLIRSLSENQLQASLEVEHDGGVRFTIKIPIRDVALIHQHP